MEDYLNSTVLKINFNFLFYKGYLWFRLKKNQILTWIPDFCMSYIIFKIFLIKSNQNTDTVQFLIWGSD